MDWVEWVHEYAPTCPACRVYGNYSREGEEACLRCRVDLMPENSEPAKIYTITRGQVIAIGDTAIDINHVALWQAIDRYKVRESVKCFELVNKVFHHYLKIEMDKRNAN